ncbi:MAG: hypothetical protein HZA89_06045 [Verrucomicrobia bacterium]|nr:hypothetical protein [Verrucomicrobiota bacterium]
MSGADIRPFKIKVVDTETGRGVPLVELTTVNHLRFVTDSAGLVAFAEPGLLGQEVFFSVRSHGHVFAKDGFGYAGKALKTTPGGAAEIKIKRLNIAERLYRVTGQGIYRDSVRLGEKTPVTEPLLNSQITGQDSVQAAVYRGKIYWFWGDTDRARYPLGNFHTTGAISELPANGGLAPATGVNLRYFTNGEGFAREMVPNQAEGPVWIQGLLTVSDETGRERLVTHYTRVKDLSKILEHGLAVFNDEAERFDKLVEFDVKDTVRCPDGHATRVSEGGANYFYFSNPYPTVRVKARFKSLQDQNNYEVFTCLEPGTKFSKFSARVERDAQGRVVYGWKENSSPMNTVDERELLKQGKLKPEEARFQLQDAATQKPVVMHTGTVNWNAHRRKWILLGVETGGTSFLGEVWYAEADSPAGPWRQAVKIATHECYSFYNPAHHPFFDEQGGRIIYFEGTYTHTFSGNKHPTPWYDYNQVMYRLDLDSPRLRSLDGKSGDR